MGMASVCRYVKLAANCNGNDLLRRSLSSEHEGRFNTLRKWLNDYLKRCLTRRAYKFSPSVSLILDNLECIIANRSRLGRKKRRNDRDVLSAQL